MKTHLLAVALLVGANSVAADMTAVWGVSFEEADTICVRAGEDAKVAMRHRQMGSALANAINVAESFPKPQGQFASAVRASPVDLVLEAYTVRTFDMLSNQNMAVDQFHDFHVAKCRSMTRSMLE